MQGAAVGNCAGLSHSCIMTIGPRTIKGFTFGYQDIPGSNVYEDRRSAIVARRTRGKSLSHDLGGPVLLAQVGHYRRHLAIAELINLSFFWWGSFSFREWVVPPVAFPGWEYEERRALVHLNIFRYGNKRTEF